MPANVVSTISADERGVGDLCADEWVLATCVHSRMVSATFVQTNLVSTTSAGDRGVGDLRAEERAAGDPRANERGVFDHRAHDCVHARGGEASGGTTLSPALPAPGGEISWLTSVRRVAPGTWCRRPTCICAWCRRRSCNETWFHADGRGVGDLGAENVRRGPPEWPHEGSTGVASRSPPEWLREGSTGVPSRGV